MRTDLRAITDLGCGTGVCGAAWARLHTDSPQARAPVITGIDTNAWTLDEARWNWRTLGLQGHAVRGDLVGGAARLLKQPDTTLSHTGVIAGWAINELDQPTRMQLLDVIDTLVARGVSLVILEPLARGVTPWWDDWAARLAPRGVTAGDLKLDTALPQPLAGFSDAAGFRKQELGVRVMHTGAGAGAVTGR